MFTDDEVYCIMSNTVYCQDEDGVMKTLFSFLSSTVSCYCQNKDGVPYKAVYCLVHCQDMDGRPEKNP